MQVQWNHRGFDSKYIQMYNVECFQHSAPLPFRYYMDVSKNRGTPKSSILIGFSLINHPFWGTPIFGNTHMLLYVWPNSKGMDRAEAVSFRWHPARADCISRAGTLLVLVKGEEMFSSFSRGQKAS